jgi:hypothetical protein
MQTVPLPSGSNTACRPASSHPASIKKIKKQNFLFDLPPCTDKLPMWLAGNLISIQDKRCRELWGSLSKGF